MRADPHQSAGAIVVGIDGSAAATTALAWAVGEAARRKLRVVAVTAWSVPSFPVGTSGLAVLESPEPYLHLAQDTVQGAVHEAVAETGAAVDIEAVAVEGTPGRTLVDLSHEAVLLVVGGHAGERWHRVLGSTSSYCLNHATSPVVVVKSDSVLEAARVVVGLDGSQCAKEALRWAADTAQRLGVPLVALRAWKLTGVPSPAGDQIGYVPPIEEWEQAAAEQARGWVSEALGEGAARVDRVEVVHGGAADGLLSFVVPSDLLVLGSRGHGGFRDLLLGSVSRQCAEHAGCVVVVVRDARAGG